MIATSVHQYTSRQPKLVRDTFSSSPSQKKLSSFAEIRFGKMENNNFEEIHILPPPYKTYIFSLTLKRKLSSFAGNRFEKIDNDKFEGTPL